MKCRPDAGMDTILHYGIQLLVMAVLSLVFGVAAGNTCATASTGFARNLQERHVLLHSGLFFWKYRQIFSIKSGHPYDHRCYQCPDVLYDDNQDSHKRAADHDIFIRHGLCDGRQACHDISGDYPAAGDRSFSCYPQSYSYISQSFPQVRCPSTIPYRKMYRQCV